MSIKQHLETALKSIEMDKDRAISIAREKVIREKIVPKNNEIDTARTQAINARTEKLNADIAKLQAEFAAEKQAMIDASEKTKADFANQVIAAETSVIAVEYDKATATLRKQISEIKE